MHEKLSHILVPSAVWGQNILGILWSMISQSRADSNESMLDSLLRAAPVVDYDAMRRQLKDEIPAQVEKVRDYTARLHKAEVAAKDTVDLCAITMEY